MVHVVETTMPPTIAEQSALVCSGLVKRYGQAPAVDGVDLTVPRGNITALLGASGCGKTTVLRMIAGLLRADAGTITINGGLVAGPRTNVAPEKRPVGLVFQDYALFPHLSVARNIGYGIAHLPRRQRRDRVAEVLDLVGLGDLGNRLPSALSGGQQQRVALARALAPSPEVILLDEPFSNLDAALRAMVREEVRTILRAADTTAVFVTHDQEEALSLADQVAVMSGGRIHQCSDPESLYTRPATRFVAEFVGEADVLRGTRAGDHVVDTVLGRLRTTAPLPGDAVDAMVRPEALRISADPTGPGVVTGIEYFGHDQLVHVSLPDGTTVRSRRGPELDLARGDRVAATVDGEVAVFAAGS
jgi:iron(III) transport system ATP-binding protein